MKEKLDGTNSERLKEKRRAEYNAKDRSEQANMQGQKEMDRRDRKRGRGCSE